MTMRGNPDSLAMESRAMRGDRLYDAERGAVLLVLLFALLMGGLAGWLSLARPPLNHARNTTEALAVAKASLLGYAMIYPETHAARQGFVPGHLPCPDMGSALPGQEGTEAGVCGAKGVSVLGHFPWRSLGVAPLRDASQECLWYLVSGHHKANPKADLLNGDTPGLIEIVASDGVTVVESEAVAVLLAPGAPLSGQQRRYREGVASECRLDHDARQYLEELAGIDNAAPNVATEARTRVVLADDGALANDRLLWVSRAEWQAALSGRLAPDIFFAEDFPVEADVFPVEPLAMAQRLALCLAAFGNASDLSRLPFAAWLARGNAPPDTFNFKYMNDRMNNLAGRPPYSVGASLSAMRSSGSEGAWGAWGSTLDFSACPPTNAEHSGCRLLVPVRCPVFRPVAGPGDGGSDVLQNSHNGWWDKWKDHFFYAVAPGFAPAGVAADLHTENCGTRPDDCLWVAGRPFAAVILFAGTALPGQTRVGSGRTQAANYLEGINADSLQNGGNRFDWTGNDQMACLERGLDGNFRVVANCGRADCRARAASWLACVRQGGNEGSCSAPQTVFQGCACLDAALAWQGAGCAAQPSTPVCRRQLAQLARCG
jgi:hypothetical protein